MDLIKIGDCYINARQITDVAPGSGRSLYVHLGASGRTIVLEGDQARALLAWLDERAYELAPATPAGVGR